MESKQKHITELSGAETKTFPCTQMREQFLEIREYSCFLRYKLFNTSLFSTAAVKAVIVQSIYSRQHTTNNGVRGRKEPEKH